MTPTRDEGIAARKALLRAAAQARRAALPEAARALAARQAAWAALHDLPWWQQPRVAAFWPLAGELDTRPLLHSLYWLGALPALPRMPGRGRPLTFHAWTPESSLAPGALGVMQPVAEAPASLPEIVLTPLLAFDAAGRRLGYGGGFYDRTFAALAQAGHRPLRVGWAFACQEVEEVPEDEGDVRLDHVVTEAGLRRLGAEA